MPRLVVAIVFGLVCVVPLHADERLKGIACRSVHLGYPAAEGTAFYCEAKVAQSAPGTYFMVCGWDKGYFGMQELGNGKKLILFSVWDSGQNDPKAVDDSKRVKLLQKDDKVRIGRFGGEGTGGQSFFDYDWKVDTTYQFMVKAKVNGERTEYSGYFFVPEEKKWKQLVTFSTITGGKLMKGYYSFVEDFKRDKESTKKVRKAYFGNAWAQDKEGAWQPLTKARFTADANPVTNIDSGVTDDLYYLITGGETTNSGTKLRESNELPKKDNRKVPVGLP